MRFLMNAKSSLHANLLKGILDDAGIPVQIEEVTPLGTYGRLAGFRGTVGVYLERSEDYDRALEIAKRHEPPTAECETCGYDLTGLRDPRCPECGSPFNLIVSPSSWTCGSCQEEIEGQFTDCWKCGAGKPEV